MQGSFEKVVKSGGIIPFSAHVKTKNFTTEAQRHEEKLSNISCDFLKSEF
jgi:hypothetical protein